MRDITRGSERVLLWLRGNAVTEQPPASRNSFSRREGIVARQKIRRVATNKVKLRPTVFFAGDCALETRII